MRAPVFAAAAFASTLAGSADAQMAVVGLPSTHRAYMRAWGGDPDSWDLYIGSAPLDALSVCGGAPIHVSASKGCWPASEYYEGVCYGFSHDVPENATSDYVELSYSNACVSDLPAFLDSLFADQAYVRVDYYNDSSCGGEPDVVNAVPADGQCHARYVAANGSAEPAVESRIAGVDEAGAAIFRVFATADCSGEPTERFDVSEQTMDARECVDRAVLSVEDGSAGGLSAGAIAGIVLGAAAVLALVAGLAWRRRRRKDRADEREKDVADATATPLSDAHVYRGVEA